MEIVERSTQLRIRLRLLLCRLLIVVCVPGRLVRAVTDKATRGAHRQLGTANHGDLYLLERLAFLFAFFRPPGNQVITRGLCDSFVDELIKRVLISQGASTRIDG